MPDTSEWGPWSSEHWALSPALHLSRRMTTGGRVTTPLRPSVPSPVKQWQQW